MAEYLNLFGLDFFLFGVVFVSYEFEVGTVRLLQRVNRQSRTGLIFIYFDARNHTSEKDEESPNFVCR